MGDVDACASGEWPEGGLGFGESGCCVHVGAERSALVGVCQLVWRIIFIRT